MNTNVTVPEQLRVFFCAHPKLALAFSGGCDSAYLLYAAKECGTDVSAYYVHSQFQPEFELQDAERLAKQLNCRMRVLDVDVLADANVKCNPANRCYHCKNKIFSAVFAAAAADGYDTIIDGTNASDDASDRPGMRALEEMRVISPLRLCAITKAQVREYSRLAGLFTWNKPAYACLATRIPRGMEISTAMLERVERAENRLAGMGFSDFRVRVFADGARLEIREDQMDLLVEKRLAVLAALENDFENITLNLRLRREKET